MALLTTILKRGGNKKHQPEQTSSTSEILSLVFSKTLVDVTHATDICVSTQAQSSPLGGSKEDPSHFLRWKSVIHLATQFLFLHNIQYNLKYIYIYIHII